MDDARELWAFARELAVAADEITLPAFLAGPTATAKADGTPVTEADTGAEALIRRGIEARYPHHGILGEELGEAAPSGGDGTRWIIDPIDGTVNFARGIQVWATLIAVERDGELLAAVASAPALGQRWSAYRGGGATTSRGGPDLPIHVSVVTSLAESSLVHAGIGAMDHDGRATGVRAALDGAWRDRGRLRCSLPAS